MKIRVLCLIAGAAAGALVMWLVQSSGDAGGGAETRSPATGPALSEKEQKLTARVHALEKELKAVRATGSKDAGTADAPEEKSKASRVITAAFDDKRIDEMMRQRAERDVNREVDRTALRLNLSAEQKESLRKYLMDGKERDRETFRTAMKNGGKVEASKPAQSKDEFLNSILTPDQQADYAKLREEQRTARAEEYAQRKVRKLNNDLNLSEEQKDKLFQAYAQQKLAATDASKQSEPGDVIGPRAGGTIAFASVGASAGGSAEPVEIEFDAGDFFAGGGGDLDRGHLESILTPEQLAVYDQRRADEQEHVKKMIQTETNRIIDTPAGDSAPAGDAPK